MRPLVFVTIWTSLALFVAGEAGKRRATASGVEPSWAWPAWTAGAVLAIAHMVLALAVVHGWSHDAAIRATAEQTAAVYGVPFGRGIYVSYAFGAIWLADAVWWRVRGTAGAREARWTTVLSRAFFLLIIVNGAVIFTSPYRRAAGVAVTLALLWIWRPRRTPLNAPVRT